jgi:hypothetical protein
MPLTIDYKCEAHNYWFEKTNVCLSLAETASDQFALYYTANYSGVANGSISGGPVAVNGNGVHVVNPTPRVTVTISNYSDNKASKTISLHVAVAVQYGATYTVFDQTLGGKYGIDGWQEMAEVIAAGMKRRSLPA